MKIVNLYELLKTEKRSSVARQYMDIPQPMYVYHSLEELQQNEEQPYILLTNQSEYYQYFNDKDMLSIRDYQDIPDKVFIKTIDTHIPTYTDDGENTFYEAGDDGEPIHTDGVYVRIYKIHTGYQKHFVYTSSGIWSLGLNSWRISGGVKKQFSSVTRGQSGNSRTGDRATDYKKILRGIMESRKTNVRMVRLVHILTDMESEYFWKPEQAVGKIFGSTVLKEDRLKIIQSNAFRKVLMEELKLKNPSLVKAIRDKVSAENVANYISKALEKSQEDDTAKGMLDNIERVIDIAYTETATNAMPGRPTLDPHQAPTQIESGAKEDKAKEAEKKDKKLIEERKESLDYPDSFVHDDTVESYVPITLDTEEDDDND